MNKIIFISVLLISNLAFSKTLMMCWPSQHDTRFVVDDENDSQNKKFGFYITNPMGYQYMPQFEGPTSQALLSYQKMQFDDLQGIGTSFKTVWSKESCELNSSNNYEFTCNGEVATSDDQIKAVSLTTTFITETKLGNDYKKIRYRIGLAKNGNTYFVTLEYPVDKCTDLLAK